MAPTKPTAATFFASQAAGNRTKIQAILDAIAAGSPREKVLSEVSGLTSQMNQVDRDQLVSMVYQQLAAR